VHLVLQVHGRELGDLLQQVMVLRDQPIGPQLQVVDVFLLALAGKGSRLPVLQQPELPFPCSVLIGLEFNP